MTRYIPPSIDDRGGIEAFLDTTKEKHNGYDSKDLIKNWKWGEKGMNISNLAVMFDVTWTTMKDWLKRLHKENNKPWPSKK